MGALQIIGLLKGFTGSKQTAIEVQKDTPTTANDVATYAGIGVAAVMVLVIVFILSKTK